MEVSIPGIADSINLNTSLVMNKTFSFAKQLQFNPKNINPTMSRSKKQSTSKTMNNLKNDECVNVGGIADTCSINDDELNSSAISLDQLFGLENDSSVPTDTTEAKLRPIIVRNCVYQNRVIATVVINADSDFSVKLWTLNRNIDTFAAFAGMYSTLALQDISTKFMSKRGLDATEITDPKEHPAAPFVILPEEAEKICFNERNLFIAMANNPLATNHLMHFLKTAVTDFIKTNPSFQGFRYMLEEQKVTLCNEYQKDFIGVLYSNIRKKPYTKLAKDQAQGMVTPTANSPNVQKSPGTPLSGNKRILEDTH